MINHRIDFSHGYFDIEGENEDNIIGRFKLKKDLRWFCEKEQFIFYKSLKIIKCEYICKDVKYENEVLSLGPYYSNYLSRKFNLPFFTSFIINHKTNPKSGFRNTPIDTKKNDLKIIGNFFGNLIKIQKPINIKEYQYISFVPSKSIYNWCNTEELAKELAAVLNINLIKIIERINDFEKHYASIPSLPINHNQKLIIVDDLYTTGQTIANIKNALEKYYFSEILVFTLGKTDYKDYEYYYKKIA